MFRVGDKVIKNPQTWTPSDFDQWDAGVGIGEVVAIEDAETVDVRWPTGRMYCPVRELLPA